MNATSQRELASRTARTDPRRAHELARAIADPWYRCQSLAAAGLHLREERVLEEAFAAALELTEPNRIVTVSAWPLKALVLIGSTKAGEHARRLLSIIAPEPSPLRRADALRELFGAVVQADVRIAQPVAEALVNACLTRLYGDRRNKKGESLLVECLAAIKRIDPQLAKRALGTLPEARAKRAREGGTRIDWPNLA